MDAVPLEPRPQRAYGWGYWPQQGSKWLQQDAVLHQYQILNWKNVCVSHGGRTDGRLDESAVWVIDGQRGAVRGKLRHTMSISGCLPLMHSFTWGRRCALSTLDTTTFSLSWLGPAHSFTVAITHIVTPRQGTRTDSRGVQSLPHLNHSAL